MQTARPRCQLSCSTMRVLHNGCNFLEEVATFRERSAMGKMGLRLLSLILLVGKGGAVWNPSDPDAVVGHIDYAPPHIGPWRFRVRAGSGA